MLIALFAVHPYRSWQIFQKSKFFLQALLAPKIDLSVNMLN